MAVWITILLTILPLVLEWLMKLLSRGGKLKSREKDRLDNVLWYMSQIESKAVKAGCEVGGVKPEV